MTKGIRKLKADVREEISVLLTAQQGDYDLSCQALSQSVFHTVTYGGNAFLIVRDEGAETQDAGKLAGTYIQLLVFWGSLKVGR